MRDRDNRYIFENYMVKGFVSDVKSEDSEHTPSYSHEKIAAIMPRDINIKGKEGENNFFNIALPYVAKVIKQFNGNEKLAARFMYYDEDFNSDLISTYAHYQKYGFPKLNDEDAEKFKHLMSKNEHEKSQNYADEMQRDYKSQKLSDEEAENYGMPSNEFKNLKLKKSEIKFKTPSKELPYTHSYIRDLAKQDSREVEKEEIKA